MRALWLVLAVGCSGAGDKAPVGGHDTGEDGGGGDSADTGCQGDDCLPEACSVLDLCDNGIDDDCNGEVDEAGCSLGWVIGTADGQGLGTRLDGDGVGWNSWVYGNQHAAQPMGFIGTAELGAAGELSATWTIAEESPWFPSVRATSLGSTPVIAYGTRDNSAGGTAVLLQPPMPGEGTEAAVLSTWRLPVGEPYNVVHDIDLWADASGSLMMVGTRRDLAVLIDSPEMSSSEDMLVDARAIFVPDDEDSVDFGVGVGLLPDGAGDGATLALVSAVNLNGDRVLPGVLWAFDAAETGVVGTDAAVASITLDALQGLHPRPAGDMDGDGYPDLLVDMWSGHGLLPGPLVGDLQVDDIFWTVAPSLSPVGDIDGDGNDDLLATSYEMDGRPPPRVCLFYGPIPRARVEAPADADACVDEPLAFTQAVAADINGDGLPEILAGDSSLVFDGMRTAGIIAAFPLP